MQKCRVGEINNAVQCGNFRPPKLWYIPLTSFLPSLWLRRPVGIFGVNPCVAVVFEGHKVALETWPERDLEEMMMPLEYLWAPCVLIVETEQGNLTNIDLLQYFKRASPVALVVKNWPASAGDLRDAGLMPGSGRFPGGGHGNPLQYSRLENPMDRGAWWATVDTVTRESDSI